MQNDLSDIRRDNLKLLARRFGSIAELNVKLGRPRLHQYLYSAAAGTKYKNGRRRSLGPAVCLQLEKALDLPAGWMNEIHAAPPVSAASGPAPSPAPAALDLPAVSIALLDELLDGRGRFTITAEDFGAAFPARRPEDFRGLIVTGDTMAPRFLPGDKLLIDVANRAPAPGFFVVEISGRRILRTIAAALTGELVLTTEKNPAQCMPLAPGMEIIGRAVYQWRGMRLI